MAQALGADLRGRVLKASTDGLSARQTAARTALRQVVQTFFSGSLESAVKTFLSDADTDISDAELDRLSQLIAEARSEEGEEKNA